LNACQNYPRSPQWDLDKTKTIPKNTLPKTKDGIDLTGFIEKCCICLESPLPIEEIIK